MLWGGERGTDNIFGRVFLGSHTGILLFLWQRSQYIKRKGKKVGYICLEGERGGKRLPFPTRFFSRHVRSKTWNGREEK